MTRGESKGKKYIELSKELAIDKFTEYMKLEGTPGKKIHHGKQIMNYEKRKTTTKYLLVIGNILVLGSLLYTKQK